MGIRKARLVTLNVVNAIWSSSLAAQRGWVTFPEVHRLTADTERDPSSCVSSRDLREERPGPARGSSGERTNSPRRRWKEGPQSGSSLGLGETGARLWQGLPGAGAGAAVQNCLSTEGEGGRHSEHAACQSLGPGRSACWLHPEPAPRDAGGGSQDQSRRLCAPLPQQQGTKVGQGGRRGPRRAGGGARGAQKAPRGRGPGEGAWKSKTMCAVALEGAGQQRQLRRAVGGGGCSEPAQH